MIGTQHTNCMSGSEILIKLQEFTRSKKLLVVRTCLKLGLPAAHLVRGHSLSKPERASHASASGQNDWIGSSTFFVSLTAVSTSNSTCFLVHEVVPWNNPNMMSPIHEVRFQLLQMVRSRPPIWPMDGIGWVGPWITATATESEAPTQGPWSLRGIPHSQLS